jgi:hypothetical protein
MWQNLNEVCGGWWPRVPGFHISLFLLFAGLGDSLLNLNTTTGIYTVIPIFSYILTIFGTLFVHRQTSWNSFSGIIWYLFQKSCDRKYGDRASNGDMISVSANRACGGYVIQWLITVTVCRSDNLRMRKWKFIFFFTEFQSIYCNISSYNNNNNFSILPKVQVAG